VKVDTAEEALDVMFGMFLVNSYAATVCLIPEHLIHSLVHNL